MSDGPAWRPMRADHLPAVNALGDRIHTAYPEAPDIPEERLRLYPSGCFVLGRGGDVVGYVVSHPWVFADPPPLNTLLGRLPEAPSTYYIYDLVLDQAVRGGRFASRIVERLIADARRHGFANLSLVAVNASTGFWTKFGFAVVRTDSLDAKLRSYDGNACYMVANPDAGQA